MTIIKAYTQVPEVRAHVLEGGGVGISIDGADLNHSIVFCEPTDAFKFADAVTNALANMQAAAPAVIDGPNDPWVCINGHSNDHANLAPDGTKRCATPGCQAEAEVNEPLGDASPAALTARHMAERGGSEPDGPVGNADGYTDGDDHDPEECTDPRCEEPACVRQRDLQAGERRADAAREGGLI